jgi:hypothetical protein
MTSEESPMSKTLVAPGRLARAAARRLASAALLASSICAARVVTAQGVPAAVYRASAAHQTYAGCPLYEELFPYSCAVDYQWSNPDTGAAFAYSASYLTSGGARPTADIQASASGDTGIHHLALAYVRYSVVVRATADPPPVDEVPLRFRMRGHVSASAAGHAQANATAAASTAVLFHFSASAAVDAYESTGPLTDEYDVVESLVVAPGEVLEIHVAADTRLLPWTDGTTEAQALADPEIEIDPTFPWASSFYLETSFNLDALFLEDLERGTVDRWSDAFP